MMKFAQHKFFVRCGIDLVAWLVDCCWCCCWCCCYCCCSTFPISIKRVQIYLSLSISHYYLWIFLIVFCFLISNHHYIISIPFFFFSLVLNLLELFFLKTLCYAFFSLSWFVWLLFSTLAYTQTNTHHITVSDHIWAYFVLLIIFLFASTKASKERKTERERERGI